MYSLATDPTPEAVHLHTLRPVTPPLCVVCMVIAMLAFTCVPTLSTKPSWQHMRSGVTAALDCLDVSVLLAGVLAFAYMYSLATKTSGVPFGRTC
jgi:hypothetical protein